MAKRMNLYSGSSASYQNKLFLYAEVSSIFSEGKKCPDMVPAPEKNNMIIEYISAYG